MRSRSVGPAGEGEGDADSGVGGGLVGVGSRLEALGNDDRTAAAQAAAMTETSPRSPLTRKRRRDSIGADGRALAPLLPAAPPETRSARSGEGGDERDGEDDDDEKEERGDPQLCIRNGGG